jgi:ketosteroid isomerase-like protein
MGDAQRNRQAARRELVRRTLERFSAGDRDVRPEEVDPQCEIRSAMVGSIYRGYDGVRSWMREIDEQFDSWHLRLDQFAQATEDRLLILGSIHFRGRGSGIELQVPGAWLFEFREGRILRMTTFATHDQARREAGVG